MVNTLGMPLTHTLFLSISLSIFIYSLLLIHICSILLSSLNFSTFSNFACSCSIFSIQGYSSRTNWGKFPLHFNLFPVLYQKIYGTFSTTPHPIPPPPPPGFLLMTRRRPRLLSLIRSGTLCLINYNFKASYWMIVLKRACFFILWSLMFALNTENIFITATSDTLSSSPLQLKHLFFESVNLC